MPVAAVHGEIAMIYCLMAGIMSIGMFKAVPTSMSISLGKYSASIRQGRVACQNFIDRRGCLRQNDLSDGRMKYQGVAS